MPVSQRCSRSTGSTSASFASSPRLAVADLGSGFVVAAHCVHRGTLDVGVGRVGLGRARQ